MITFYTVDLQFAIKIGKDIFYLHDYVGNFPVISVERQSFFRENDGDKEKRRGSVYGIYAHKKELYLL